MGILSENNFDINIIVENKFMVIHIYSFHVGPFLMEHEEHMMGYGTKRIQLLKHN